MTLSPITKEWPVQRCRSDSEEIQRVLDILRGKWTIYILCEMRQGPVRLSHLKRAIPGASKKALTSSLRWLERAELIVRRDMSKSVLHIEYELMQNTREPLSHLLAYLANWSKLLNRGSTR